MTGQEIYETVCACWMAGDFRHPMEIVGPRPEERKSRWVWDVLALTMEHYNFPKDVRILLRKVAHTCHLDYTGPAFD